MEYNSVGSVETAGNTKCWRSGSWSRCDYELGFYRAGSSVGEALGVQVARWMLCMRTSISVVKIMVSVAFVLYKQLFLHEL